MITRAIAEKVKYLATKFPVITLTGARQCGKSTLLKMEFPEYRYISLEAPDIRNFAAEDPRGFLSNFNGRLILDEVQYVPQLFSYIQTKVDETNSEGQYILSGSQNFLLMEKISQSLAGRTAVLKLGTLSYQELKSTIYRPENLNDWLYTGGYPRIYDKSIAPSDFYPSYIQTYLERDVQSLKNIGNMTKFIRFLKLCAARIGQLLNVSSLANECDISIPTANVWLSILESSFVVYLLKPYYQNNIKKRLVKSPKLYFFDTGLAASLLGLNDVRQIETHYLRGELFENMVISEFIKKFYASGTEPDIYFWQDSNKNEVALLVRDGLNINAYEIKSNATLNMKFFKTPQLLQKTENMNISTISVIYGGDADYETSIGKFLSWRNL